MVTDGKVLVIKDTGKVVLFFDDSLFRIEKEKAELELGSLIFNGSITGYNIERLVYGEITLFYNPFKTEDKWIVNVIDEVISFINDNEVVFTDDYWKSLEKVKEALKARPTSSCTTTTLTKAGQ